MSPSGSSPAVAVVGLDVRGVDVWPGEVCWQAVRHEPFAGVAGAPPLSAIVDAALANANLHPNRLPRVFVAGTDRGSTSAMAPGAEYLGTDAALVAVVRAYAAIAAGATDLAVAIAVGPSAHDGTVPSAAVVLSRMGTAPSYATVQMGIERPASDGDPCGQFPLLVEACSRRGISPRSLTLLDVQADGPEGATQMLDALRFTLPRETDAPPRCLIAPGSDGRTAVEAMAAVCLHALALHVRVRPAAWAQRPPALLVEPFGANAAARPWIETAPRRSALWACVASRMSALILEEIVPPPSGRLGAAPRRPATIWPRDLVLLSAPDRLSLSHRLRDAARRARENEPLAGLAGAAAERPLPFRAGAIAADPADAAVKLDRLAAIVEAGVAPSPYITPDGLYFGEAAQVAKTALLFPGQGSPYVGMFGDLCLELPWIQDWFEGLHGSALDPDAFGPGLLIAPPDQGATPACRAALAAAINDLRRGGLLTMTASLAMHDVLRRAGIRPDALAGYSNGENAALAASAGGDPTDEVFAFMRLIRLHEESEPDEVRGKALVVNRADRPALDAAIEAAGGALFLALDNCPDQVVLFGEPSAIDGAARRLRARGALCLPAPFGRGHHTPRFLDRVNHLRPLYAGVDRTQWRVPIYSCVDAAPFPDDPDAAREVAVGQWARPVRFGATIERLYADGVRCFVETGPGSTLTGFVRSTLKGRPHVAVPTNVSSRPGLEQLLHALAHLFIAGHPVDLTALRGQDDSTASRPSIDVSQSAERPAAVWAGLAPDAPEAPPPPRPPSHGVPMDPGRLPQQMLVEHFQLMREFLDSQLRAHAAVTARLRRSTSRGHDGAPTHWPILGSSVQMAGGHLEAVRPFDVSRDLFLWHHAVGAEPARRGLPGCGLPVVPFSISLECLAEAAVILTGWRGPALTFDHLRANRWLAVDRGTLTLRIDAERVERAGRLAVRVRIREAEERGAPPAFEGIVTAGAAAGAVPASIAPARAATYTAEAFNGKLFHGPLFHCVRRIVAVDEASIDVEAAVPEEGGWFLDNAHPAHLLPIGLLDATSQVVGAWLVENGRRKFGVFPFEWRRLLQYTPPPGPGAGVNVLGRLSLGGQIAGADIDLVSAEGGLMSRVEGLRAKVFDFAEPYYTYIFGRGPTSRLTRPLPGAPRARLMPLNEPLLAEGREIWLRVLAAIALAPAERDAWWSLPAAIRREWLLARIAAKEVVLDLLAASGAEAAPQDVDLSGEGGRLVAGGASAGVIGFAPVVTVESVQEGLVARLAEAPALAGQQWP